MSDIESFSSATSVFDDISNTPVSPLATRTTRTRITKRPAPISTPGPNAEGENADPSSPVAPRRVDKGKKRAREESDTEPGSPVAPRRADKGKKRAREESDKESGSNSEVEECGSAYLPSDAEDGCPTDVASEARNGGADSEAEGQGAGAVEEEPFLLTYTPGGAPLEASGDWDVISGLPTLERWNGTFRCTLVNENGEECDHEYKATKNDDNIVAHLRKHHADDLPDSFMAFLAGEKDAKHTCFLEPGRRGCAKDGYRLDTIFRHVLSVHLKPLTHKCTCCGEKMYLRDSSAEKQHFKECRVKEDEESEPAQPVAGPSRKAGRSSKGPATKKSRGAKD